MCRSYHGPYFAAGEACFQKKLYLCYLKLVSARVTDSESFCVDVT
jgi:hypothetical protein